MLSNNKQNIDVNNNVNTFSHSRSVLDVLVDTLFDISIGVLLKMLAGTVITVGIGILASAHMLHALRPSDHV